MQKNMGQMSLPGTETEEINDFTDNFSNVDLLVQGVQHPGGSGSAGFPGGSGESIFFVFFV